MSTFNEMVVQVSRDLRDPSNKTFDTTVIGDLITAGLIEIGRIAPAHRQEDITPIADTLDYPLFTTADPEIELKRVELWDGTTTPNHYLCELRPGSAEYVRSTDVGWEVWNGNLRISNDMEAFIDPAVHIIRVWGYGPYPIVSGATAMPVSTELEWAIRSYCKVGALRRLGSERALFSQWQTRSGNTDITPAGLLNDLAMAEDDWRRKTRALFVLREAR